MGENGEHAEEDRPDSHPIPHFHTAFGVMLTRFLRIVIDIDIAADLNSVCVILFSS